MTTSVKLTFFCNGILFYVTMCSRLIAFTDQGLETDTCSEALKPGNNEASICTATVQESQPAGVALSQRFSVPRLAVDEHNNRRHAH